MLEQLFPLLSPDDTDEKCGLILKDGTIVEIKNIAAEPELGYEMDPVEVLPHLEKDDISATWHTHPGESCVLSGEDYTGFMVWPKLRHFIVGTDGVMQYSVEDGIVMVCD